MCHFQDCCVLDCDTCRLIVRLRKESKIKIKEKIKEKLLKIELLKVELHDLQKMLT